MLANPKQIDPPTDDKRWRIVQATMRRNGFRRSALIETLHTVQESFGFLDEPSLQYVATSLRVPMSQVYGVSTFYHLFSLKPAGKHTCVMCTGTACYIKGIPKMLDAIRAELGIEPGETSADGEVSLITARCLGACGIAPVAVLDGEVMGKIKTETLLEGLAKWRETDDV
ncbi:MAG: bidirectional hydrogenase complex protein HoxE [Candidatus Promineifilaceae bacterium]